MSPSANASVTAGVTGSPGRRARSVTPSSRPPARSRSEKAAPSAAPAASATKAAHGREGGLAPGAVCPPRPPAGCDPLHIGRLARAVPAAEAQPLHFAEDERRFHVVQAYRDERAAVQ